MAILETPPEQSPVRLLKGIVTDLQDLIAQQIGVARAEIKADLRKMEDAVLFLSLGAGGCLVAGVLWSFALAHLLFWAFSTGESPAMTLPLWGCYAIVAAAMTVVGAALLYTGHQKINTVQMAQTAEAVQENVTWATGQRLP